MNACKNCKYRWYYASGKNAHKDDKSWNGYGCQYIVITNKQRERDENGKCLSFKRRDDISLKKKHSRTKLKNFSIVKKFGM